MSSHEILNKLDRELKLGLSKIESFRGGKNNRLFRAHSSGLSTDIMIKLYAPIDAFGRDRRRTEYSAMSFVHSHLGDVVPEPLATSESLNAAVYCFVSGRKLTSPEIGVSQAIALTKFLASLKVLAAQHGTQIRFNASEAFFSASEIIDNLEMRLVRLKSVETNSSQHKEMKAFLVSEFVSTLEKARKSIESSAPHFMVQPLDPAHRTLSPSDIGFHNILQREDGRLVFLDFEYFGWDDPVKTLSDFLLQPEFELTEGTRQAFLTEAKSIFSGDPNFARRFQLYFPLFALKWVLILLNEFIPKDRARREFALAAEANDQTLEKQLEKAHRMHHISHKILQNVDLP